MNRKYICCLLLFIIFCFPAVAGAEPNVRAAAAVLMEKENGQILQAKNIHSRLPPASLTKILTAIVALEVGNLKDTVVISGRAAGQEGSSIWLAEGEKLELEDLLYGLLLASGNDAAVAIAEHIAGSVEEFARIMTEKAEK
ncbi:MAG: D-alanyl-D-alanine carboxypeptidase family protein, partial [Bacillota bacterium]